MFLTGIHSVSCTSFSSSAVDLLSTVTNLRVVLDGLLTLATPYILRPAAEQVFPTASGEVSSTVSNY